MAKLASNNNKAVGPFTSVPTLPRLVYYDGNTKWYYLLIEKNSTLTWNGYIYSYDKSVGDTFGIALDKTKYVVPNKRVVVFSATNWAYAYSYSNVWKTTSSGWTTYYWEEHIYTISVQVSAPPTNVYDFVVVSNSGNWTGSLVSNPDISMNGSTTKTLSVQVRFRASTFSGDPTTHFVIGLRDRTNSINTVVSQFTVNTYLSFGTIDSEE